MKPVKLGLLGLGTVGSGVYEIIHNHRDKLAHQTGTEVTIAKILVRDVNKPRKFEVSPTLLTDNPDDILMNPEIDIVVEVAGGVETGLAFVEKAIMNGKHVVTANKDLIAEHGARLLKLASEKGCDLYYEASVAGGIPIIRSIVDGLSSDMINEVSGIINGTTNYILTKMEHENQSYEDALKKAQELGYAEADPTSDVGGFDAARKIAILASLAFSMPIDLEDVRVKGIDQVEQADLEYANSMGLTMKLLGIAKMDEGAVEISVEPTLVPHVHPLASVHNEYNAVFIDSRAVGRSMFYGPGAGGLPTANSIVSDVVAVIKNMAVGTTGQHIVAPIHEKKLKGEDDIFAKYYLRLEVVDEVGVFAAVTQLFAEHNMSFEKIIQNPICENCEAEITIITHKVSLGNLNRTLTALKALPTVIAVKSCYKIKA